MENQTKKYHIELGEERVVYQGAVGDTRWGHYQFPHMGRAKDGTILINWAYHNDSVFCDGHSAEAVTSAASDDNGKTWRRRNADETVHHTLKMPNGKCFVGFRNKPGYTADFLSDYTPAAKGGGWWVYFVEDLPESAQPHFEGIEYDPETGKTEVFPATVNWPHMPIEGNSRNTLVPVEYMMNICGGYGLIELDGEIYYCTYSSGFDSSAATREEAVTPYSGYYQVYIFKSGDSGRTWDYVSQVLVTHRTLRNGYFEGFCEPMMRKMPDGSICMLMRTGGGPENGIGAPCYIVRSTDNCKTWSEPKVFDTLGVLPQIMPLKCGVTLATYGRPGLFLKTTGDPTGQKWDAPVELPLSPGKGWCSCYYTNMLELDDNTALLAYSDFYRPVPNGEGVARAIVVREIKAVLD